MNIDILTKFNYQSQVDFPDDSYCTLSTLHTYLHAGFALFHFVLCEESIKKRGRTKMSMAANFTRSGADAEQTGQRKAGRQIQESCLSRAGCFQGPAS